MGRPATIVSLDPWGAMVAEVFAEQIAAGIDIRPTIAVTKAQVILPEVGDAIGKGRLHPDGRVLLPTGAAQVTKAAIEPVWYLPGVAGRFGCSENDLRRVLFEETGGMYPELVTRRDLEVFLPPIGGQTVYIFGNPRDLADPSVELTARVHDECNGSDVFGSDICTCRPYLTHAIEECVQGAQRGGVGLVAYSRKEGRALGEVTKFLVYNARKRQVGGDTADQYFARTECVAGVQDMRFQELMPDVLHWLGIRKIHRLVSMSNMKYDAITGAGIEVGERVSIPDELIPADAQVEMDAKIAAGYYTPGAVPGVEELRRAEGQGAGRMTAPADAATMLRSTAAVQRSRSAQLLDRARSGASRWFTVHDDALEAAADDVAALTRARFPDLDIPYHSRWRHFEAGGVDRRAALEDRLDRRRRRRAGPGHGRPGGRQRAARCRRRGGLGVREDCAGRRARFTRSEGLAVASWHGFVAGTFSSDPERPLRVDAAGVAGAHRARPGGAAAGHCGQSDRRPAWARAGAAPPRRCAGRRPRGVRCRGQARRAASMRCRRAPAASPPTGCSSQLLTSLARIWPSANMIGDVPVGDCWRHDAVSGPGLTAGWCRCTSCPNG